MEGTLNLVEETNMSLERDIDLVNDLRDRPAETEWIEFKLNNDDPDMIGKLTSAISNAARIAGVECAYIIWGISNETHGLEGTNFDPDIKTVGNQVFKLWLAQQLHPSIAFNFREVLHPDGKLILMEVPAATTAPVSFKGDTFLRIGSATPRLTDYPDRYQQLIEKMRPYT